MPADESETTPRSCQKEGDMRPESYFAVFNFQTKKWCNCMHMTLAEAKECLEQEKLRDIQRHIKKVQNMKTPIQRKRVQRSIVKITLDMVFYDVYDRNERDKELKELIRSTDTNRERQLFTAKLLQIDEFQHQVTKAATTLRTMGQPEGRTLCIVCHHEFDGDQRKLYCDPPRNCQSKAQLWTQEERSIAIENRKARLLKIDSSKVVSKTNIEQEVSSSAKLLGTKSTKYVFRTCPYCGQRKELPSNAKKCNSDECKRAYNREQKHKSRAARKAKA